MTNCTFNSKNDLIFTNTYYRERSLEILHAIPKIDCKLFLDLLGILIFINRSVDCDLRDVTFI